MERLEKIVPKEPPIPSGYKHIGGEWNKDFTIQRISDKSEFLWIPTRDLEENGTVDGKNFSEQFGIRRKRSNIEKSYDLRTNKLFGQLCSTLKYGGYYVSKYFMSANKINGNIQSIEGGEPLILTFNESKKMAESFETSIEINSHLIFGAECDTIQEWYNESNIETKSFLTKLWDGNIATWTQENMEKHVIARGGQLEMGKEDVVFYFRRKLRKDIKIKDIGFLIALTLK